MGIYKYFLIFIYVNIYYNSFFEGYDINNLIPCNYYFDNSRDIYISYFFLLNLYIILININIFFIFRFITLRVAEASIGLSLLTILVRNHGNDYIKIMIF